MARPTKNNADYFSHDANMRDDPKIKAVRKKYGHEGYSIYNMLIEYLTDQDYFQYELTDLNLELLSGDFDIEATRLNEIIQYFCYLDLFQIDVKTNILTNKTLNNRLESVLSRRKPRLSGVNVNINTQSKVKESKVNETKEKESFKKPKFGSDFSNEELFERLINDTKLKLAVEAIGLDILECNIHLTKFITLADNAGKLDQPLNEVKHYFINWLKNEIKNNNNGQKIGFTEALRKW